MTPLATNDNHTPRRPSRLVRFLTGENWWIAPTVVEIGALIAAVCWIDMLVRGNG